MIQSDLPNQKQICIRIGVWGARSVIPDSNMIRLWPVWIILTSHRPIALNRSVDTDKRSEVLWWYEAHIRGPHSLVMMVLVMIQGYVVISSHCSCVSTSLSRQNTTNMKRDQERGQDTKPKPAQEITTDLHKHNYLSGRHLYQRVQNLFLCHT